MTDQKLTALTEATSIGGSDYLYLVQDGFSKKVKASLVAGDSYNILGSIPTSEHAAIKARTSTYDCTAAFNTALATYPRVFVPEGTYTCNDKVYLRSNNTLFGTSTVADPHDTGEYISRGSVLKAGTASFSLVNGSFTGENLTSSPNRAVGVRVGNIRLDGSFLASYGLWVGFVGQSYFEQIQVYNFKDVGVCCVLAQNSEFHNINVNNCPIAYGVYNGTEHCDFYGCYAIIRPADNTFPGIVAAGDGGGNGKGFYPARSAWGWRYVQTGYRAELSNFPDFPGFTFRTAWNTFFGGIADGPITSIYPIEVLREADNSWNGYAGPDRTSIKFENTSINYGPIKAPRTFGATYGAGTGYAVGANLYGAGGDGTGPSCPEPAAVFVDDYCRVYWNGNVVSHEAWAYEIINNGEVVISGDGGDSWSFYDTAKAEVIPRIKNGGHIFYGSVNSTSTVNLLPPKYSTFGSQVQIASNEPHLTNVSPVWLATGDLAPAGAIFLPNSAVTMVGGKMTATYSVPGAAGASVYCITNRSRRACQDTFDALWRVRIWIEAINGGSGLLSLAAVFSNVDIVEAIENPGYANSTTTSSLVPVSSPSAVLGADEGFFPAGNYEFIIPGVRTTMNTLTGDWFRGIAIAGFAGDPIASFVVRKVIIEEISRHV